MPETTAKIRAKGLATTGVSEDLAQHMFNQGAGQYHMAIVELMTVEPHGPTAEGKRRIDLVLTQVEPATTIEAERVLRDLARAIAMARRVEDGQLTLDGTNNPQEALTAATAAAEAYVQRDEDGKVTGVWDGDPDGGTEVTEESPWGDGEPEPEDSEPEEEPAHANVVTFSGGAK